jgi:hypothetical protein
VNDVLNKICWNRTRGGGGPLYVGHCPEHRLQFSIIRSREPGFEFTLTAHDSEGRSLGDIGHFKTISGAKSSARRFGTWRN